MRDILFKAKSVDNGKWVTGYYQKRHGNFGQIEHLIFHSVSALDWEYVEINPDTLCQYTGMTDKNGNKIWEHDIVKGTFFGFLLPEENYVSEISWQEYIGGWGSNFWCSDMEVIGNIFDNAELLGGDR